MQGAMNEGTLSALNAQRRKIISAHMAFLMRNGIPHIQMKEIYNSANSYLQIFSFTTSIIVTVIDVLIQISCKQSEIS